MRDLWLVLAKTESLWVKKVHEMKLRNRYM